MRSGWSGGEFSELLATVKPSDQFLLKVIFEFTSSRCTFPDNQYAPSERFQGLKLSKIPLAVSCELLAPEFAVRGRCRGKSAPLMKVPKTAMNQDHRSMLGQYKIGATWQISSMKSETETGGMK
jgi:hypothetical protein